MDSSGERERQLIRAVQQAEWRRQMLQAGSIDADDLSEQGRRILAWLADWTVGGVVEMLGAAYRAGLASATTERGPVARDCGDGDAITARLADLQRRSQSPEVGL